MAYQRGELSFFRSIHVENNISISIRLISDQVMLAGTSRGVDSNETNEAGAGKVTCQNHVVNQKHIFTTRVPMATKLDRIVTYRDGLFPIKSRDPAIKWSCKIT